MACSKACRSTRIIAAETPSNPPKTMRYTSWQIQQATEPFLYGTIEVRAKVPGGVGTWPAIWMLGHEWQASQPSHGQYTRAPSGRTRAGAKSTLRSSGKEVAGKVNTTIHYNKPGGLHIKKLPFDATTRFAVYRLEWTQGAFNLVRGRRGRKGLSNALHRAWFEKRIPTCPCTW